VILGRAKAEGLTVGWNRCEKRVYTTIKRIKGTNLKKS
jgi:hypothetical protein